jgi:hypothetical protein
MKKKITLFVILFTYFFSNKIFAQAPPEILHYNFNGTSTLLPNLASSPPVGTTNATIVGTQTLGGTGQCGSALVGDGSTTSEVNTGWATNLSGSWSISFWTASITPSSTLWYIFGDPNASSFRCFTNGVAGANNWMLRGPITDITLTGGATMAPHLNTFVYNSTLGTITAYLDAVFNASITQGPVTISGSGPFTVGHYGTNSGLPSGGLMDEFRFYSRALTLTEIQALLNVTPTSTNLTITSCGPYTSAGNNTYTSSGSYTETFNSCGGMVTNTLNLTVNPVPTLTATASNTLLCDGESTSLNASGTATSYSWSSGSTASSTTVSPSTNTIYIISASLASCSVNDTLHISVNPTPFVSLSTSNASVCLGHSVTLTASGAPNYSWNPVNSSNAVLIVSPTISTTYSVTGTNTFNCSDTKTIQVVIESFTPGITSSTAICIGEQVNIQLNGASGTTYTWSNGMNGFSGITVSPTLTSVYSATAIGANFCYGSNSTTITVNPNPTVVATAQRTMMCKGEKNTLTASGAASYSWSVGSNPTTASVVINPPNAIPYSYSVTGKNAEGCASTFIINIQVNACTALTELTNSSSISIFPNPVSESLTIQLTSIEPNTSLIIRNALGAILLEQSVKSNELTLDLQNYANGVYFIYVQQNNKPLKTSSFIKH